MSSALSGFVELDVPGMVTSGVVAVAAAAALVCGCAGRLRVPFRKAQPWVVLFVFLSAVLRLSWWLCVFLNPPRPNSFAELTTAATVLNRLSWMFSTISFLLLLFSWMETVHSKYPPPSDRFAGGVMIALVVSCVVIGLFVIAIVIVQFVPPCVGSASTNSACQAAYDANVLVMAALQLLVALGFFVYGVVLLCRLARSSAKASSRHKAAVVKLILCTFVFTSCFAVRAAMLIYRPATGLFLPTVIFNVFTYIVPDFIPPLVQIFLLLSTVFGKKKAHVSSSYEAKAQPLLASSQGDGYVQTSDL